MFKSFGTDANGKPAFKPVWAIKNFTTAQKMEEAIRKIGTPANNPPASPDIFHLRIGAANFYVPPVSISVNTGFKTGSMSGGAIRQKASPKFNSGYKETTVNIRLYFPNYEEIWGLSIDDASKIVLDSSYKINFKNPEDEQKVDKFLSSLRGLVAAFKYAPILPIKNHYLNSVHGITGVALSSMNISTIPNYPFALVVDLELLNFNHKPFLPMLSDFNQAVHWGKFRQYMGKAAGAMYNYINEEFILESPIADEASKKTFNKNTSLDPESSFDRRFGPNWFKNDPLGSSEGVDGYDANYGTLSTNVYQQWQDGKNIFLYIPAKIQSKIYTPDESTFRTPEEMALTDVGRGFWEGILNKVGINVNESANYHRTLDSVVETARNTNIVPSLKNRINKVIDAALVGVNSKEIGDKVYKLLALEYIADNKITDSEVIKWLKDSRSAELLEFPGSVTDPVQIANLKKAKDVIYNGSKSPVGHLQLVIDSATDKIATQKKIKIYTDDKKEQRTSGWKKIREEVEKKYVDVFNVSLYERFFTNADITSILEAARDRAGSFSFNEWDVPMILVDLDQKSVIVNSVNVTLGNNLAKMQLQMLDEPTYQHIGAKDSYVNVSMTVFGEKELIKLKKMFDFLSGLARLEHAAGVIGFMGIKNIITALAGIKYVMPLSYSVDTIPNFPHVYNVQLSLVDFDVYQQKREKLSTEQQRKFIEEFKNKRNPFLRLKQNWSVFNAYPDLPLGIRDEKGNILGCIDPDFYFRSFEMMDNDVVNNIVDPDQFSLPIKNELNYNNLDARALSMVDAVKQKLIMNNGSLEEVKNYLIDVMKLKPQDAVTIFRYAVFDKYNDSDLEANALGTGGNIANKYPKIWKDFIDSFRDEDGKEYNFEDIKFETRYGQVKIGELISGSKEQIETFNALVQTSTYDIEKGELPSIDPDEVNFMGVIHYIPAANSGQLEKIPAIMQTPDGGFVFGYSDEKDGKFYIAADNLNLVKDSNGKLKVSGGTTTKVTDTSSPDRDLQGSHTGVPGASPLPKYANPYASSNSKKIQSVSTEGSHKTVAKHWQKMMLDTQYRDLSGRMIRAFPTYMLWLIDEGGYFSGVKLFDNFYGLQSVIDFSIVQSEDILGDTLVLRLSNVYSKLSKPELTLTDVVNTSGVVNQDNPNLTEATASIIDVLLNTSRNLASNFQSNYVTEIDNIRLKPGVRVHLRAGYGSNPNSLQTLFNGVITNVENGEILTVTAQSDAIELSPIINSTKKKGDSGKIDGGLNTGLWMSEPRDLMIRLLSMGTSRTREAFAHATRGSVFSENKFGIRHFGTILYEPLTEKERQQAQYYRNAVANAGNAIANNPIGGSAGTAWNSTVNILTGGVVESAGGLSRTPIIGAMHTLWSNLSTQRDLEIFKRNIYPGNGLGIAQFLGGDIDDGWSVLVSVDDKKLEEEKFGYLNRLTDSSWSKLIQSANKSSGSEASQALDSLTFGNKLVDSSHAVGTTQILGGVFTGLAFGGLGPVGLDLGSNLLKSLGGRGATSIFKTMGLVSDLDDDLYDEVSFRAQTYMKSVWDIFQLCAKLLPNYIVAVRPFEDRSTVFYGKPHWLYTSGVVPISTGFINDSLAQENGLNVPQWISPDTELSKILDTINKESSPIADANALANMGSSSMAGNLAKLSEYALNFDDVFKAGSALNGQIINFSDKNRNEYYDNGEIKSILPVNKGAVQVGFHLPFGNPYDIETGIQEDHKQVSLLPLRYTYPFFTNRVSGTLPSLDFDRIFRFGKDLKDYEEKISNIVAISKYEKDLVTKGGKSKLLSKDQAGNEQLNFNFDFSSYIAVNSDIKTAMSESAAFDPSGLNTEDITGISASVKIQMPLPVINLDADDIQKNSEGFYEFNSKYKDIYADLDFAYNRQVEFPEVMLSFSEWTTPKDADHEQFYIAMRWPYNPVQLRMDSLQGNKPNESIQKEALNKFVSDYGLDRDKLVGTPTDYKKRRVLVYNPDTQQAVVCAPAYFLWGETHADSTSSKIEAIVSPDAAYFLGLLIDNNGHINSPMENLRGGNNYQYDGDVVGDSWDAIGMSEMNLKECMFTFVDDNTPLGVVTSTFNPAKRFYSGENNSSDSEWIIGFGNYKINEKYTGDNKIDPTKGDEIKFTYRQLGPYKPVNTEATTKFSGLKVERYEALDNITLLEQKEYLQRSDQGGNYLDYFNIIQSIDRLDEVKEQTLIDKRNIGEYKYFQAVYDPLSKVSIQARGLYDEDFDRDVKVLAGNGRTLKQGQDIWDQFRWGYHNYESVKDIFAEIYGMDPDDDDPNSSNPILNILNKSGVANTLIEFGQDKNAIPEFSTLLGADWLSGNSQTNIGKAAALNIAVNEYVDAGFEGYNEEQKPILDKSTGIIDIFNAKIEDKVSFIKDMLSNNISLLSNIQLVNQSTTTNSPTKETTSNDIANDYLAEIKTPKQLFLLLVGLFRQKLWEDPYSRAWLVLKPDRKRWVLDKSDAISDAWSFRPVDKIWQAFIDYNSTYGKDSTKFKKLLQSNAKEGNSATSWMSGTIEDAKGFYDKNIGPIWSVFTSAVGNLMNMFRLSIAQMGYGLNEIDNFSKQAAILNKAYNDSIYYSLGREGTLLRAVDNPFTREYAEPVVEIREPFQRMHYISSFSHILSNQIQENLGGVATQITAVSDSKYPVTVALDKGAPAERQVEKTVETGIYFDNIRGSGMFGVLHPLFHPLQTIRGISKAASGEPDELTARRIALAHLKESIKDIYSGEIMLVGNPDIRPHDLVYIADAYERVYGIFEVEQVVHHFTPEMGFITSVTPNAFVTVNDPARWFMSSWISSHFSMQNLRNDTRILLSNSYGSNLVQSDGQISVDSLAESLRPQMLGGIMYTHGHSALIKDITANMAADAIPGVADQIKAKIKASTGKQEGSAGAAVAIAVGGPLLTTAATAIGFGLAGPLGAGIGFSASAIGSDLAWSGWKWIRDNVLDQHGCYVQYLNKNGQAMDAGLSFNQGMVVGKYHSKKLLPGILGARTYVRTPEGNSYIRSDDLFKSMGWREKEITDLVRHISLENAIVNSEILKYSGIGPEKTGLNQFFKVIGVVTHMVDGDTFDVKDILRPDSQPIRIRFDGINTAELAQTGINAAVNSSETDITNQTIFNPSTASGAALKFTYEAINGRLVVLRINPKTGESNIILEEEDLEAGAIKNNPENYTTARKGESYANAEDRYMATIFYKTESKELNKIKDKVRELCQETVSGYSNISEQVKDSAKNGLFYGSVIEKHFDTIYNTIYSLPYVVNYFELNGESDPLSSFTGDQIRMYNTIVAMMILKQAYKKASEWPIALWDEYYEDGSPITLNWELVVNGLAKVYTKSLLFNSSPAQITIDQQIPTLDRVNNV